MTLSCVHRGSVLGQRCGKDGCEEAAAGGGPPSRRALAPEDWEVAKRLHERGIGGVFAAWFRALPSSPRCGVCGAPFAGIGRWVVGPLGYRRSRKNPTVCGTSVEFSPPGGMRQYIGVLFADLRASPRALTVLILRRRRCSCVGSTGAPRTSCSLTP